MTQLLTSLLAFIFALGVIIFIHELGHLLVAKLFDTRVKTFSLGFGKRLFGTQRGETDYRVSLIPLGGYVALGGENPEDATGDPREFLSKPRWQRILVYLAGPVMNVVLSVALIALTFMIGIELMNFSRVDPVIGRIEPDSSAAVSGLQPEDRILTANGDETDSWQALAFVLQTSPERPVTLRYQRGESEETATTRVTPARVPRYEMGDWAGLVPKVLPQIIRVEPGRPAEAAGLQPGDQLRTMDGKPIVSQTDFVEHIEAHAGEEVTLQVERNGELVSVAVVPEDRGGSGKIGVQIGVSAYQRYGFVRALRESVHQNIEIVRQTFLLLGKILTGELSARSNLGGPIEIAAQSGAAAERGFSSLLYFMGFISISIAILNLMPIPILDGGQIVILLVESVIRRDLPLKIKEAVTQVGFVLIMLLMLMVIWFDLARNFGG